MLHFIKTATEPTRTSTIANETETLLPVETSPRRLRQRRSYLSICQIIVIFVFVIVSIFASPIPYFIVEILVKYHYLSPTTMLTALNPNNQTNLEPDSITLNPNWIATTNEELQYYTNFWSLCGHSSTIYNLTNRAKPELFYTEGTCFSWWDTINLYSYNNNELIATLKHMQYTFSHDVSQFIINNKVVATMRQPYYVYTAYSNQLFNIYIGSSTSINDIIYTANGYWYDRKFNITNIKTNQIVSKTTGDWFQWLYHYNMIIEKDNDISLMTLINFAIDVTADSIMSMHYIISVSFIMPILLCF